MLNVIGINSNHNLHLVTKFLEKLNFVIWFITRKDTSCVEILQHFSTKLKVELAIKLVDAIEDMIALQIQILFGTKSLFLHLNLQ